jgi:DNA-binding transcriptional regulator YiaG
MQALHDAVKSLGDAALDIATALSACDQIGSDRDQKASVPAAEVIVATGLHGSMNITSGAPLTAERFSKLMSTSSIELWVLACCQEMVAWESHPHTVTKDSSELYASFEGWCRSTDTPCPTRGSFIRSFNRSRYKDRVRVHGRGPGHPVKVARALSYATGKPLSEASSAARVKAMANAKSAGYDYEHWCSQVVLLRKRFPAGRSGLASVLRVSVNTVKNWELGTCFARGSNRRQMELVASRMYGTKFKSWRKPQ